MKKFIALLLALVMVMGLVACGDLTHERFAHETRAVFHIVFVAIAIQRTHFAIVEHNAHTIVACLALARTIKRTW